MAVARRRTLLIAGAASLALPRLARPQPHRRPRVGLLSPTARGARDEAFVQGLREHGYVPGANVDVEMRFADGMSERLPLLAGELVRLGVDVLVAGSTIGGIAAKRATATIPIVFAGSSDPVAGGLVSNLARPGGNVTGVSLALGDGVAGKWLELLAEVVPGAAHYALVWSPTNAAATMFVREIRAASAARGLRLDAHEAPDRGQLDRAFDAIAAGGAQALIFAPSPFAAAHRDALVAFAGSKHLPAMYFSEDFVEAGGLMSYGPSYADAYRRAASYVARILKGARPGDLAVEQPTAFDLVVNARTAKALGLTMPPSILLRASRVIG